MAVKPRKCDEALRDELWRDLLDGENIQEAYINGDGDGLAERVYGLQEGSKVYINPVHSVMDTLVHEMIHRRRKNWGERRVIRETSRIINSFTDSQVRKWHRQYEKVKVARKTPISAEDE